MYKLFNANVERVERIGEHNSHIKTLQNIFFLLQFLYKNIMERLSM